MVTPDSKIVTTRIDELLATLDNPQAAYVVRSRLDRVLLMTQSWIEDPGVDPDRTAQLREILGRLEDSFRALRRRSEPFADAWIGKLAGVRRELLSLRSTLLTSAS